MTLAVRIRHSFGDFMLDVDFEAPPGLTVLFGRSGSGKTTVINAVAGLLRPDEGRIAVDGQTLLDSAGRVDLPPHRRGLGYVFQEARLFPHMSVRQNLKFSRWFRKGTRADFGQVVEMLGIGDLLDRRPGALSGGERQRVAIARALALNPKLIVADEAVSALDVSVQAQVVNLMLELQAEMGLSFLFISHDMAVVERVSHHVGVMYLGRIVEMGTRSQVFENPQHPYTQALMKAVPIADPRRRKKESELNFKPIPSPIHPTSYVAEPSVYKTVSPGHQVLITDSGY